MKPGLFAQLATIFPSGTRKKVWLLAVLMMLTACVEALGVASIMPFVAVLTSPELIAKNTLVASFFTQAQHATGLSLPAVSGLLTLCLLLVSNSLAILTQWGMMRFSHANSHVISTRLLRCYLGKPYSFFLARNTADLSKNITHEVHRMTIGVVIPLLTLLAKGLTVLLVVGLIMLVDARLAVLAALVLGGLYALIYMAVKKSMAQAGRLASEAESKRFVAVQQALEGIAEIKVFGKAWYFANRYELASQQHAKNYVVSEAFTQLPKYALEVIAFGGMVVLALVLIAQGKSSAEVLSVIGLFAFAGYRLMPNVQHIYAAIVQIRYSRPALENVAHELYQGAEIPNAQVAALPLQEALKIENLHFSYAGSGEVISTMSLTIPARSTIGFAGASGCGKTTLMHILLGLLAPTHGRVVVDGAALTPDNMRKWQAGIGFVPQSIYLLDDTIAANIAFGVAPAEIDHEKILRAARRAHIHSFIETLPQGYATHVGERGVSLSGGQRQRIAIARALYHEPSVLILDEATSALDGSTEAAVMEAVREMAGSLTIIIVAHRLTTLMVCDCVHVLERGKVIASGSYAEVIDRAKLA